MEAYKNIDECISELSISELRTLQDTLEHILDEHIKERLEVSRKIKELEKTASIPDSGINLKDETSRLHQQLNDKIFERIGSANLLTREMAIDFYDDKLWATFNDKYKSSSHYKQLSDAISKRITELENNERKVEVSQPFFEHTLHQLDLKELKGAAEMLEELHDQYVDELQVYDVKEKQLSDSTEEMDVKREKRKEIDAGKQSLMKKYLTALDQNGLLSKKAYSAYNLGDADALQYAMEDTIVSAGKEIDSLQKELDTHLARETKEKKGLLSRVINAVIEHSRPDSRREMPDNTRLHSSMPEAPGKKRSFFWGNTFLPWPVYLLLGVNGLLALGAELLVRKVIQMVQDSGKKQSANGEGVTKRVPMSEKEMFQKAVKEGKYKGMSYSQGRSRSPEYNSYLHKKYPERDLQSKRSQNPNQSRGVSYAGH